MQETTNFKFLQPDGTDKVLVSNLNENMIKLDEILADIYSKLPQPGIDLPITISVADMVQHPFDEASIIYSNTTQKLNISMDKQYICTFVGKDGNNYVYNNPLTPQEITEEGITFVQIGGFNRYHFTPQLVSPMTALDTMLINNGVSFDSDGNPVINGFFVDMAASDSQGHSHTDALVASIDSVIISEYTS